MANRGWTQADVDAFKDKTQKGESGQDKVKQRKPNKKRKKGPPMGLSYGDNNDPYPKISIDYTVLKIDLHIHKHTLSESTHICDRGGCVKPVKFLYRATVIDTKKYVFNMFLCGDCSEEWEK